jgi:hypothetical protein
MKLKIIDIEIDKLEDFLHDNIVEMLVMNDNYILEKQISMILIDF